MQLGDVSKGWGNIVDDRKIKIVILSSFQQPQGSLFLEGEKKEICENGRFFIIVTSDNFRREKPLFSSHPVYTFNYRVDFSIFNIKMKILLEFE